MKFHVICFALLATLSSTIFGQNVSNELAQKNILAIEDYMQGFASHNADQMNAHYADGIDNLFQDPVFSTPLSSLKTKAMWQMLLANPLNFSVSYKILFGNEKIVHVSWVAKYDFSATKRHVLNVGQSTFLMNDGKIVKQADSFDLCSWLKMALPIEKSLFLCSSPELFRADMANKLDQYIKLKN